jgi:dUTP pyrophosphatase
MFIPEFDDRFVQDFIKRNDAKASPSSCAYITWEGMPFPRAAKEGNYIIIPSHDRVCIPSGCHFDIEAGFALIANNKSGVATKDGLVFGAAVCDSDYQGEVHISLINTSRQTVFLKPGQKVIQFLYMPVRLDIPVEVPFEELYKEKTDRGAGGFGSTGDR